MAVHARLFQRVKSSMQSGRGRVGDWVLEYEPAPKFADPLTGWTGSRDTQSQVTLSFPTLEAAKAYADAHGLVVRVVPLGDRPLKLQAYADNFK